MNIGASVWRAAGHARRRWSVPCRPTAHPRANAKGHDAAQRRSAQTLRTVDTLNIASFERVKYERGEAPGALRRQHREQNSSLNAAVTRRRGGG